MILAVIMSQFTSVSIAVVEYEGRFLVGRRAAHVPLGGLWEFPGGKMEAHESPQATAARECLEETGIPVVVSHCLVVNLQLYEHGQIKLYFYACYPKVPFDPQTPLRPPYQWVSRKSLAELEFPEGNKPVLQQLLGR